MGATQYITLIREYDPNKDFRGQVYKCLADLYESNLIVDISGLSVKWSNPDRGFVLKLEGGGIESAMSALDKLGKKKKRGALTRVSVCGELCISWDTQGTLQSYSIDVTIPSRNPFDAERYGENLLAVTFDMGRPYSFSIGSELSNMNQSKLIASLKFSMDRWIAILGEYHYGATRNFFYVNPESFGRFVSSFDEYASNSEGFKLGMFTSEDVLESVFECEDVEYLESNYGIAVYTPNFLNGSLDKFFDNLEKME